MNTKFLEYYRQIHRVGADRLLEYLKSRDFFTAPASTKYHGAYPGGLVEHCVNVYERLLYMCRAEAARGVIEMPSEETIAICGLLHDVCKMDFYVNSGTGWNVMDALPIGHAEKSLYIVGQFMALTDEEAIAIRWHMGFSDASFRAGERYIGEAYSKCPLAVMLFLADMQATYLDGC